jgi:hypothetical protein
MSPHAGEADETGNLTSSLAPARPTIEEQKCESL